MDLGKFVDSLKNLKKDFDTFLDPVKEAKAKAEAKQAQRQEYVPEPAPVPEPIHTKSETNDHEVFLAQVVGQKEERIDCQEFLYRLHRAGRVMHGHVEVIDVMRLRMDQINALKAYCGYSPNHDLTIQVKYARSQAQKELHKNYVIEYT
jgi:hypothetical protein